MKYSKNMSFYLEKKKVEQQIIETNKIVRKLKKI